MAVINGCSGKVVADSTTLAHARDWTFNWAVEPKSYSSSSTNCTKKRIGVTKDVQSGTFNVYIDDAQPIEGDIEPGDIVTLDLYDNDSRFWKITDAMITGIAPTAQIEADELAAAVVTFEGGAVTIPA